MMPYPIKLTPYFRHDAQTPWGGRALADLFGKAIPDELTGESLEISAVPGMESTIINGALAGRSLTDAFQLWNDAMTGAAFDAFPLLVKLLDARDMLSVQVHPNDAYAREHAGKLGKTEAWIVLQAAPGAQLVYGVEQALDLRQAVAEGTLENALRRVAVAPGDVLYIPHGMVHALGGGIVVYEIQESSDVTYRFWDWNRVGKDGKSRALHIAQALDVTRPELALNKLPGATVLCEGGSFTAYICDTHFELMRLNCSGVMPLAPGRMHLLTALTMCELRWDDQSLALAPGESALVPAACEARLVGLGPVLRAGVPDREGLRAQLLTRAELVAGLTDMEEGVD